MMGQIFTTRREHDGALVLSAIVQDGKSCGPYRRERTYYGYTLRDAKALFRRELYGNGGQFDDEYRGY
jgi:hypothetical protein